MKYISRILFVLAVMLCGAGTAQAATDDLSIVTTGVTGASVTAYVSDSEPTVPYSAPGSAATVVQHDKYLVLKVTPVDGKWLNNEMLEVQVAGGPGGALGRTRSGMMVAEHPTALSTNQADGTGYYYYQIPSGCTAANGYKNVVVTGAAVSKTATTINVAQSILNLNVNDEVASGASLTPAEAGSLTYSSDKESVAVVVDGVIKAVGEGTATITVSFAGNAKYAAAESKTITVDVSLITTSVSVNQENLDLFVDDQFTLVATTTPDGLAVSFVPDDSGVYSVDGNGLVKALKQGVGSVLVKVGGDGVYAQSMATVNVTVSKVPTEITVAKANIELEVNDEVATGATLAPAAAGSLTYTSDKEAVAKVVEGKIKAVGEGTATITVSFAGDNKYAAAQSKTITVQVSKVTASGWTGTYDGAAHGITVTAPTGATVKYGTTDGTYDLTASPTYKDVNGSPYTVYYQVTKTRNTVVTGSATVTISPKEVGLTWTNKTPYTYNGSAQAPTVVVKDGDLVAGDACTVNVTITAKEGSSLTNSEAVNVGSYTAKATGLSNTNYKLSDNAVKTADFEITRKGVNPNPDPSSGEGKISITVSPATAEYDGTDKKSSISVTVKDGEGDGAVTIDPNEYDVIFKKDGSEVSSLIDVADYTIVIQNKAGKTNGNYDVNGTATFKITPKEVGLTWSTPTTFHYNAQAQQPTATVTGVVKRNGQDEACSVKTYTLSAKEGSSLTNDKAVNVGSYTATATALDNANYKLPTNASQDFTIEQEGSFTVSFDASITSDYYVYDGTAKEPKVVVKDGDITLEKDKDYEVSYENNVNAGENTASVKVTAKGNFSGSKIEKFSIHPKEVGLTWDKTSFPYNGQAQQPKATVMGVVKLNGVDEACTVDTYTLVAKDGSSLTEDKAVNEGSYTVTATKLSNTNYKLPTEASHDFTIVKGAVTGSGIEVRRNDTKALVDNEAYLTEINGKLRIDHVNIINPDPANGIAAGVSVYIPASLKNVDNKTGDTYGVGSDLIVTDAKVPVTDVYMPETEEMLNVATKAFRLVADESKTAFIHVPLPLLDDYALTPGLKAEYEAGKVMTTVKPATQYWTFSSAVDVVVPEGLTANICSANGLKAVAITAITETTATVDGVTRILVKANNGVVMKGTANSDYALRAWPSEERPSGLTPIPTADAKSYAGNELVPATVKTHFTPTEYYILYNETFYELKPDDNTSVSACKAVLKRTSASQARSLSIDGEGTTGIDLTPIISEDDGVWYSIDGRKLDGKPTRKGLYIKNGQKTVIR